MTVPEESAARACVYVCVEKAAPAARTGKVVGDASVRRRASRPGVGPTHRRRIHPADLAVETDSRRVYWLINTLYNGEIPSAAESLVVAAAVVGGPGGILVSCARATSPRLYPSLCGITPEEQVCTYRHTHWLWGDTELLSETQSDTRLPILSSADQVNVPSLTLVIAPSVRSSVRY